MNLKLLKKIYDFLATDKRRIKFLKIASFLKIRKNVVRLDTNNVCNIECIMCSNKPQKCKTENTLAYKDFQSIIDKSHKTIRLLYLSCGFEPLMTPDFYKYLIYAKKKKIPFISLATNGLLLNKSIIHHLVDNRINEVIISFNGLDEEDYNRIMFRSNYKTLIKNLTYLKEYKEKNKSIYPKVRLNLILMKSNLAKIYLLENLVDSFNIETVQFRQLAEYSDANNLKIIEEEKIENIPQNDLIALLKQTRKIINNFHQRNKNIIFPLSLFEKFVDNNPPKESSPENVFGHSKKSDKKNLVKACSLPFFSYWIDYLGQVRICPTDQEGLIGNLINDSWASLEKKSIPFRKKVQSGECQKNCTGVAIDSSTII